MVALKRREGCAADLGEGVLVHRFEDPAFIEPEPGVGVGLDFLIKEGHDFACEAA